MVVASADVAAIASTSGNPTGAAATAARLPMTAYGILLLAVGLWCVATSFATQKAVNLDEVDDLQPVDEGDERAVIHALRNFGWYVADDVLLPHAAVDHIAVGPAGVLAVQVQWTNRADNRGKPAVRARIAAQQVRKMLAAKELSVEVVPVVLTFGPGLTKKSTGVRVIDTVAMLNGYQAEEWISELTRRTLLADEVVDAVRTAVGDLREAAAVEFMVDLPSLVSA